MTPGDISITTTPRTEEVAKLEIVSPETKKKIVFQNYNLPYMMQNRTSSPDELKKYEKKLLLGRHMVRKMSNQGLETVTDTPVVKAEINLLDAYFNLTQKSPVMKNSTNTVSASMKSTTRKLAEGNIDYLAPITMKSTKQMNADIELDANPL